MLPATRLLSGRFPFKVITKLLLFGGSLLLTHTASAQVPHSSHVVLVIEENTGFSTTMANMPWLVGEGNAYGYANNYTTNSEGSLLDYLWLSSGSCHTSDMCTPSTLPSGTHDFGCSGGGCSSIITDDNIFRELNNAGISWKLYAESLPSAGWTGGDTGEYVERHNPARWYSDVFNSSAQLQKMVPFTQFATDLSNNQLPSYSIIVPNLLDDAHDGSPADADTWLKNNVAPLLGKSYFQSGGDGLLIITFDNGDGDLPGQVFTVMIGPNVKAHTVSNTPYMHQSALRTILESLGITVFAGASAGASDMADFFASGETISLPRSGTQVASPVPFSAKVTSSTGTPITAMKVYLDSQQIAAYDGNGDTSLSVNTFYSMAGGSHTLAANAWDTSGKLYQASVSFTALATPGVVISTPPAGAQVTSPVPFSGTVTSGGLNVTTMKVYIDGSEQATYSGNNSPSLKVDATYPVSAAFHTLVANAWDSSGNLYQSATNFTALGTSGVAVNTPAPGAQVGSPMAFNAMATSTGAPITAMKVYIDNIQVSAFNGNGTSSLTANTFYPVAAGAHTLAANAWDTSGNLYQTKLSFTSVGSSGVAITAPGAGTQVKSTVPFSASATSSGGLAITAMKVYLGSQLLATYNGNGTSSLSVTTFYSIAAGSQTLTVNAWDTGGNLYQTKVNFTVGP